MITEDRLKKALTFLAETDEPAAQARAYADLMQEKRKVMKATMMLDSDAKSNQMRECEAYCSIEYREHLEEIKNAVYEYETLRLKRQTESQIVEVWRSENANRRSGNI